MSDKMWDGAACGRMADVVSELERGADLNAADGDGWTVLLIAAKEGAFDIAAMALERGADVTADKKGGFNLLHMFAQSLETNPPVGATETAVPLFRAAIEKGAPVDGATSKGQTPLFMAASFGQPLLVAELLEGKAQVDLAAANGSGPLHVAAIGGHREVVEQLLAAGADVNCANDAGFTALHGAAESGDIETCKALVEAGADLSAETTAALEDLVAGMTAHAVAVAQGKSEVAAYLEGAAN